MGNQELIKVVENNSTYTRQEREEWVKKIKSGDPEAIAKAQKLLHRKLQAQINYDKEAREIAKKSGGKIQYKNGEFVDASGNKYVAVISKDGSVSFKKTEWTASRVQKEFKYPTYKIQVIKKNNIPVKRIEKYLPPMPDNASPPSPYSPPIHQTAVILPPGLRAPRNDVVYNYAMQYFDAASDMEVVAELIHKPKIEEQKAQIARQESMIKQAEAQLNKVSSLLPKSEREKYEEKIKEAKKILERNKKIVESNERKLLNEVRTAELYMDIGKTILKEGIKEYGTSNDLMDMIKAGGTGAIVGGVIAGITAGPEAIPIGMAIGGISSEVGQAAGEIVTYKTGKPAYGMIADIGLSTITAMGLGKGLEKLAEKTAQVSITSDIKIASKGKTPMRSIAQAETEIEYKTLGGAIKRTKSISSLHTISSLEKDTITKEVEKGFYVTTKAEGVHSHIVESAVKSNGKWSRTTSNYITKTELGMEKGNLNIVFSEFESTTAKGSKLLKTKGISAAKFITEQKGDVLYSYGRVGSASSGNKVISKANIEHIVFTGEGESTSSFISGSAAKQVTKTTTKNVGVIQNIVSEEVKATAMKEVEGLAKAVQQDVGKIQKASIFTASISTPDTKTKTSVISSITPKENNKMKDISIVNSITLPSVKEKKKVIVEAVSPNTSSSKKETFKDYVIGTSKTTQNNEFKIPLVTKLVTQKALTKKVETKLQFKPTQLFNFDFGNFEIPKFSLFSTHRETSKGKRKSTSSVFGFELTTKKGKVKDIFFTISEAKAYAKKKKLKVLSITPVPLKPTKKVSKNGRKKKVKKIKPFKIF